MDTCSSFTNVILIYRGSIQAQAIRMASVVGQKYDLVIFGASGYTGQYAVKEVAHVAQSEETEIPLSWAIAGRSKDKLLKSLATVQKETGKIFSLYLPACIIAYNFLVFCIRLFITYVHDYSYILAVYFDKISVYLIT